MTLTYPQLLQLQKSHPSWRLLRADNAPFILSFLDNVFVRHNIRIISQSNLTSKLDDTLYYLRKSGGDDCFPKSSGEYLDDWAADDKGWLRKYYPIDSDEPHFDLTPATEKVLTWMESWIHQKFIGTESRLLTLFSVCFVHNPEGKESLLRNLTIEEYKKEKTAQHLLKTKKCPGQNQTTYSECSKKNGKKECFKMKPFHRTRFFP